MKSAFAALACVGLVYASCTWLGTVEDNEMCLGKAAQTQIWFIVPSCNAGGRRAASDVCRRTKSDRSATRPPMRRLIPRGAAFLAVHFPTAWKAAPRRLQVSFADGLARIFQQLPAWLYEPLTH